MDDPTNVSQILNVVKAMSLVIWTTDIQTESFVETCGGPRALFPGALDKKRSDLVIRNAQGYNTSVVAAATALKAQVCTYFYYIYAWK